MLKITLCITFILLILLTGCNNNYEPDKHRCLQYCDDEFLLGSNYWIAPPKEWREHCTIEVPCSDENWSEKIGYFSKKCYVKIKPEPHTCWNFKPQKYYCFEDKDNVSVWGSLMLTKDGCDCHFNVTSHISGLYYDGELIRNESRDQNIPYGNFYCNKVMPNVE